MKFSTALSLAFFAAPAVNAFTTCPSSASTLQRTSSLSMSDTPFFSSDIAAALDKEVSKHMHPNKLWQ